MQIVDRMEKEGFVPNAKLCANVASSSSVQSNPVVVRKWKLRMLQYLSPEVVGVIPDAECPDEMLDRLEKVTEMDHALVLHGKLINQSVRIPSYLTLKVAEMCVKSGNLSAVLELWNASTSIAFVPSMK